MRYLKISLFLTLLSTLVACSTTNPHPQTSSNTSTTADEQTTTARNETKTQTPAINQPSTPSQVASNVTKAEPPVEEKSTSATGKQIVLALHMDFQQAWTEVGKALPQAGYPVMEQDSALGTYYILDKVGTGGVIKRDNQTQIYQLHLQKTADQNKTIATLNNSQNQPADADVVRRILGALKNQIGA